MEIIEKIKDFLNLNFVILDTWSGADFEALAELLKKTGGVFVRDDGFPTVYDGQVYSFGRQTIKIELWEYEHIQIIGKKVLIGAIKEKFEAEHGQ